MIMKIFGCTACVMGAAYLFIRNIFHGNETPSAVIIGLLVLALWLFISAARPPKRQRPAQQQQPAQPSPAPARTSAPADPFPSVTFKVAGVTFDNDDGSSRQDILRHIKFRDDPYATPDEDILVDFVESDYNGELALEVTLNGYQVGFVPRPMIRKVKAAMDSHAWTVDSLSIYGGSTDDTGEKHSYGCEISLSWAE